MDTPFDHKPASAKQTVRPSLPAELVLASALAVVIALIGFPQAAGLVAFAVLASMVAVWFRRRH